MRKILIPCPTRTFWRVGLVFVFLLGLSITYTKNLALASRIGMVIDRVCEMQIDKDGAKTYKKDGHKYYFCSKKCKKTFKKNPEEYACICSSSDDGCPCYHCTGTGELCDCAEITVYMGTRSEGHEHEGEDEGGGHGH
jgi:YHS domain-containing protein